MQLLLSGAQPPSELGEEDNGPCLPRGQGGLAVKDGAQCHHLTPSLNKRQVALQASKADGPGFNASCPPQSVWLMNYRTPIPTPLSCPHSMMSLALATKTRECHEHGQRHKNVPTSAVQKPQRAESQHQAGSPLTSQCRDASKAGHPIAAPEVTCPSRQPLRHQGTLVRKVMERKDQERARHQEVGTLTRPLPLGWEGTVGRACDSSRELLRSLLITTQEETEGHRGPGCRSRRPH